MAVRTAALVVVLAASLPAAQAQPFERPPSFNAAKIFGIQRVGENYTVNNPVRSDGLSRVYNVMTPYGDLTVHGDQMLRMRLNELAAL